MTRSIFDCELRKSTPRAKRTVRDAAYVSKTQMIVAGDEGIEDVVIIRFMNPTEKDRTFWTVRISPVTARAIGRELVRMADTCE